MITHFEAVVTLLAVVIGWLSALAGLLWKARGWIDRRTAAEDNLADAIKGLTASQVAMHEANQGRFEEIERRLDGPAGRGYARLGGR